MLGKGSGKGSGKGVVAQVSNDVVPVGSPSLDSSERGGCDPLLRNCL